MALFASCESETKRFRSNTLSSAWKIRTSRVCSWRRRRRDGSAPEPAASRRAAAVCPSSPASPPRTSQTKNVSV